MVASWIPVSGNDQGLFDRARPLLLYREPPRVKGLADCRRARETRHQIREVLTVPGSADMTDEMKHPRLRPDMSHWVVGMGTAHGLRYQELPLVPFDPVASLVPQKRLDHRCLAKICAVGT